MVIYTILTAKVLQLLKVYQKES